MAKKPPSRKKPGKPLAARLAASPALVKKYQTNPGLRSKYLTGSLEKYLTPAQRKTRALNTRLNAPIAAGSSTTERDLAHEAQAAQTVRYGPQDRALAQQLGVAVQTERDTGSLYDQYRQALQQHAAAVQAFQVGAQQALGATAAGITGLGQQQTAQLQAQADAGAAQQGVAQAGQIGDLANQALAIRQGMMGTFQNEQALQGAAANTYSDAIANVVAPGQKLGALAQARGRTQDVRQKQADLATEEGAFNEQFRQERRADEFKNQLAVQTLAGNQANMAADNAIAAANAQTRAQQTSPEGVAATSSARAEGSTAAKYGYTVHQWRTLGPNGRQRVINAAKAQGKSKPDMGKVNKYGYTEAQWRAMSTEKRQQIIKNFSDSGKKPKPGEPGGGPDWQTNQRQSAARSQAASLKRYAAMAKRGDPFVAGHSRQKPANRHEAAIKIQQAVAAPDDPILLTAALDAVYDGHLSPATVRALIAAGYKPSLVASALGVGTRGSASTGRRTSRPGSGPAAARQ